VNRWYRDLIVLAAIMVVALFLGALVVVVMVVLDRMG